jgi:hypothetical protein
MNHHILVFLFPLGCVRASHSHTSPANLSRSQSWYTLEVLSNLLASKLTANNAVKIPRLSQDTWVRITDYELKAFALS